MGATVILFLCTALFMWLYLLRGSTGRVFPFLAMVSSLIAAALTASRYFNG